MKKRTFKNTHAYLLLLDPVKFAGMFLIRCHHSEPLSLNCILHTTCTTN